MKIGVDIDGVLADRHKWLLTHTKDFFANRGFQIVDPTSYDVNVMFGVSQEQRKEYWEHHIFDYANQVDVNVGGSEVLSKLQKDGHEIIINTARWFTERKDIIGEQMREAVVDWLAKHRIPYDELVFSSYHAKNKLEVAKTRKLDIHIDDAVFEIKQLATHLPVAIYDQPHNKEIIPNTFRVKDWHEFYILVNRIKEKGIGKE